MLSAMRNETNATTPAPRASIMADTSKGARRAGIVAVEQFDAKGGFVKG
jgi:hypothetical protein